MTEQTDTPGNSTDRHRSPWPRALLGALVAALILALAWLELRATLLDKPVPDGSDTTSTATEIEQPESTSTTETSAGLDIDWQEPELVDLRATLAPFVDGKLAGFSMQAVATPPPGYSDDYAHGQVVCQGGDCLAPLLAGNSYGDAVFGGGDAELEYLEMYRLGTVRSGEYQGQVLYLLDLPAILTSGWRARVVLADDGTLTFLRRYSNDIPSTPAKWFVEDYASQLFQADDVSIEGLAPPRTIAIPETTSALVAKDSPHLLLDEWAKPEDRTVAFEDPVWGPVYEHLRKRDLAIRLRDGTVYLYHLQFPFLDEAGIPKGSSSTYWKTYSLAATDPSTGEQVAPNERYDAGSYYPYSCIRREAYYVFEQAVLGQGLDYVYQAAVNAPKPTEEGSDLIYAAVSGRGGQEIYVATKNHPRLKALFATTYASGSGDPAIQFRYEHPQSSLDDFAAITPLLYWQDPLGRWLEIRSTQANLLVECDGSTSQTPIQPAD